MRVVNLQKEMKCQEKEESESEAERWVYGCYREQEVESRDKVKYNKNKGPLLVKTMKVDHNENDHR